MSHSANTPQQAIADYLDALLQDVPEAPAPEVMLAEKTPQLTKLETLIAEIPLAVEVVPEVITAEPVVEVAAAPMAAPAPVEIEDSPVPDWAQQPFQCLLFKVSGLTLAVPLVKLNSVMPWTDKIVETPNQTDWYLGLAPTHAGNVKIIDTALMVLPENRRAHVAADPSRRFSHILLVDNYRWGLACDAIGEVVWMNQDKVKWRKTKIQRPWLAGTALEQLCAIMDTEVFADMMNARTTGRSPT